jgi:hypothetical protein
VSSARAALSAEILGVSVRIEALPPHDVELARQFRHLLVRPAGGPPVVRIEGTGDAHQTLADLTWATVAASPLLCIHAGVVAGRDGLVAIPGHSGLGKTTLVANLVHWGFGYVSDEALAFDRATRTVVSFARPLSLTAPAWAMFPAGLLGPPPAAGVEVLISPDLLGSTVHEPGPVRDIVLAERRPSAETGADEPTLEPANRAAAVEFLLSRSFNHFAAPAASFHAVVELVRSCRVWRASYQDAPQLARVLAAELIN